MAGVLYIVATPIGNLADFSQRAISTLKAAAIVAAEDTRHSRHLLEHFGIKARLLSLHEHNESTRIARLLEALESGDDVALISDAGTPLISDPGYELVNAVREAGFQVSPIPGASSVIAALSAAGLPTDQFFFRGFLAPRPQQREAQIASLQKLQTTLVLFESSHRIEALLEQLAVFFTRQRCVVAKELTKSHENFLSGSAAEILEQMRSQPALFRGEFVVLIDNRAASDDKRLNSDDLELLQVLLDEVSVKNAVKIAARLTGKKKNEIYQRALELENRSTQIES